MLFLFHLSQFGHVLIRGRGAYTLDSHCIQHLLLLIRVFKTTIELLDSRAAEMSGRDLHLEQHVKLSNGATLGLG